MKVLVLGSTKLLTSETELQAFKGACRDIGSALAAGEHTVILGSDNGQTADLYVVQGLASVPGTHNVIVHYSNQQEVAPADANQNDVPFLQGSTSLFPQLNMRHIKDIGPWAVAHSASIRDADVVVMIGGGRRCDLVGHLASVLETPVLAVPIFRGSAQAAWSEFKSQYKTCGITDEEMESISVYWKNTSGSAVVSAARKLYQHNPFKNESTKALAVVSIVAVVSLALWIGIFVLASKAFVSFNLAFFALLGLSAIMGTALRTTNSALRDPAYRIGMSRMCIELVTGLILSFGFMLLYLVGSLFITGDMKQLHTSDDFMRVAVSLSAIGLATAFLLESATNALGKKLEATVFK
jgi:hypothetical protein